ncbi:MAG: flavodoxin domain-containing protein [Meiothermus sp.]|nr:flavodoxin domain-containing protein [Meiothermus sp.]
MTQQPILIAYATRGGTTQKVAEAISQAVRKQGGLVEVRPIEQVKSLSAYRAVILGSGTREQRWLPEAEHFVQHHREALGKLPTLYFMVYTALLGEFPDRVEEVLIQLREVRRSVEPLEVAIVSRDAQAMPPHLLVNAKELPKGEWSGWVPIETWAAQVFRQLELEAKA